MEVGDRYLENAAQLLQARPAANNPQCTEVAVGDSHIAVSTVLRC
jgi:hypothetical protein